MHVRWKYLILQDTVVVVEELKILNADSRIFPEKRRNPDAGYLAEPNSRCIRLGHGEPTCFHRVLPRPTALPKWFVRVAKL